MTTENDIHNAMTRYHQAGQAIAEAEADRIHQRNQALRKAHAAGWRPVDIERVTGLSRETVRQALHPEVREAARRAAAERRAARKTGRPGIAP